MLFLVGLIIPIISFFFQTYPRFFNRYFGVDVWSRLLEADLIRKNHHKIPMNKIKHGFLLEGYFNYPPVFPWLLSFLPKQTLVRIQGFIAPLFDSLQNIIVFAITFTISRNITIAVLAQLIYATTPLIILENSYLTPRSLGYLNFTLAFYPILLYSMSPNPLYLLIGFVFSTCIFFTHKFAMQSLLFISIFFSIVEKNFLYIGIYLAGFATAIFISKGYYLRVLHGHIANILFWAHNAQFRYAHQVRGILTRQKKTDFVGKIYYYLGIFTPITLIGTNLWLLFVFLFLGNIIFNFHLFPTNDPLLFKMSLWATFFYILSFMVLSSRHLIPIGEGQRYLEMGVAPTAVIAASIVFFLLQTDKKEAALVACAGIFFINLFLTIFIQRKGIIEDKNRSITKGMDKIFAYINAIKPKPKILCIPHQITTMVLYNTNADVLVDIEAGALQRIDDVFPVLKKDVQKIAQKYNVNMLVLKKYYATMKELKLPEKSLLFETEDTQIIKI